MRKVEGEAKATRAACEEALKEAKAAVECCEEVEALSSALLGEQAELVMQRCLEEEELKVREAKIATRGKSFTARRAAWARSRRVSRSGRRMSS